MKLYRITGKKWAGKLVASGFPARWNSQGTYVIYSAESRALACLENLVHRDSSFPRELFKVTVINVPDQINTEHLNVKELPDKWYLPGPAGYSICQEFGDLWVQNNTSVLLKVPSAIIAHENNYLINPNHQDFELISVVSIEDFLLDERLGRDY